jgi:membrane protein YqaA with SNARE-associated domain
LAILSLYGGTLAVCAISGVVPLIHTELYLIGLAAVVDARHLPGLALAAAVGQMAGKVLVYYAGRGVLKLPFKKERMGEWEEKLRAHRGGVDGVLFLSAFLGLPPIYAVSISAGALHWSLRRFLVVGTIGRTLRFIVVMAIPAAARSVFF